MESTQGYDPEAAPSMLSMDVGPRVIKVDGQAALEASDEGCLEPLICRRAQVPRFGDGCVVQPRKLWRSERSVAERNGTNTTGLLGGIGILVLIGAANQNRNMAPSIRRRSQALRRCPRGPSAPAD